jgi:hypothetical protein
LAAASVFFARHSGLAASYPPAATFFRGNTSSASKIALRPVGALALQHACVIVDGHRMSSLGAAPASYRFDVRNVLVLVSGDPSPQ